MGKKTTPPLVVVTGAPGAGKSTFARMLCEEAQGRLRIHDTSRALDKSDLLDLEMSRQFKKFVHSVDVLEVQHDEWAQYEFLCALWDVDRETCVVLVTREPGALSGGPDDGFALFHGTNIDSVIRNTRSSARSWTSE